METKKFKKKNGSFSIQSYAAPLTGFSICIIIFICGFFVDSSDKMRIAYTLILFCLFLAVFFLIHPHLEKYCLDYPVLYIKKGRKISECKLPDRYSLIISEMTVSRKLDPVHPVWIIGQSYVSIIDSMDRQQILDKLHSYHKLYPKTRLFGTRIYSASIENEFAYAYFDGFIYDKSIPDILFENAESLIIPRSILNRIEHPVLLLPNLVIDEEH